MGETLHEAMGTVRASVHDLHDDAFDLRAQLPVSYTHLVVVMVANMRAAAASTGFESSFVQEGGMLGMRAAVSAATLVPDSADEGRSVLASLLDGFAEDGRCV